MHVAIVSKFNKIKFMLTNFSLCEQAHKLSQQLNNSLKNDCLFISFLSIVYFSKITGYSIKRIGYCDHSCNLAEGLVNFTIYVCVQLTVFFPGTAGTNYTYFQIFLFSLSLKTLNFICIV